MGKLVDFFLNSHTKLPAKTIKLLSKNQEFVKAITENKVPISTKRRIFKQKFSSMNGDVITWDDDTLEVNING